MYVPREEHPEDPSYAMLRWREDRIGEVPTYRCNVHTRHLEPLAALKAGIYRIRGGRPHFEKTLE